MLIYLLLLIINNNKKIKKFRINWELIHKQDKIILVYEGIKYPLNYPARKFSCRSFEIKWKFDSFYDWIIR